MIKKIKIGVFSLAFASIVMPTAAMAITTLSQGFSTTDQLAVGSIVSLKNNISDEVIGASSDSVNGILGVVINDGGSLLSLSSEKAHEVQVATSGVVPVLVSDINGPINYGDEITASPIKGVA